MIAPGSSFSCGFAIESIAKLLMIEPIPQLGGETGARARSALLDDTLYFAYSPEIAHKNRKLLFFSSDRVKHSG
jgi:hypothetical protein